MSPVADEIMSARKSGAKKLSANAGKILARLGFKNAEFLIEVSPEKEPSTNCGSSCEFKFSANAGQPAKALAKIASSGELARVMLALKTILAEADNTPVLVFDEVDANVGGEIGAEVGKELAKLSEKRQVFCVTHLPQVASQAHNHFLVEKTQTKTSTSVQISQIGNDRKRRISELARMLGDRNSESALAHAEKLIDKSL
jgi:DNA repair protein RecN (Recombination protein N)